MDDLQLRLAKALLGDLTETEWDFLEQYRKSDDYREALRKFQEDRGWRVSNQRELLDGRNVLAIEQWHGLRVSDRVVVEVAHLDRFVERVLDCAERVRAAEQARWRGDPTAAIRTGEG
jgi:hypothetical protein